MWATSVIFVKLPKVNRHPLGEKSPCQGKRRKTAFDLMREASGQTSGEINLPFEILMFLQIANLLGIDLRSKAKCRI
jgi:hypothetical protein